MPAPARLRPYAEAKKRHQLRRAMPSFVSFAFPCGSPPRSIPSSQDKFQVCTYLPTMKGLGALQSHKLSPPTSYCLHSLLPAISVPSAPSASC